MRAPLAWHTLWPLATLLLLLLALSAVELQTQRDTAARLMGITTMSNRLEGFASQLRSRHRLTVRRARGAMHNPAQRVALLAWSSDHYGREMTRLRQDAIEAARTLTVPHAHPRLRPDLDRIIQQLEIIGTETQDVASALDLMLGAATAQDLETLAIANAELDRADSRVQTRIDRIEDLIRKATQWQSRDLARSPWARVWPLVILLGLGVPLATFLSLRPLLRLRRMGQDRAPPGSPLTEEEEAIAGRLQELQREVEQGQDQLGERTLDAQKAQSAARRWERELALLRIYNENLVNSLRSAIVVTNAAHEITSYNRAARQLLGLREEILDQPITGQALYEALTARRTRPAVELERALGGDMVRLEALSYRASAGEPEILLDLTIAPYLDEGGAPRGLLWVADDVTDAVRVKNQLLAAEHLATVGRLSAQVAHEIRNPLSAIGLNAEMLEEELEEDTLTEAAREEARALVKGIGAEVERLSQVTEGYLQLARMPRPECRDADLNELVSDLFSMLNQEMEAHQVQVQLDLDTPSPHAWVDPGQLRQAMLNIVRNSREAMPQGGTIRVRTFTNGDFAHLEFEDTGEGIDAETARRAFEPFYSTKPEGTGLGLSLTEQILVEHHGTIELQPGRQGGTQVRLTLPMGPM